MIPRTLATVATACRGRLCDGTDHQAVVNAIVTDSRDAGPGALFVALPGESADGHAFVGGAFEAGATACLVHEPGVQDRAGVVRVDDTWAALADLAGHVRRVVDPTVVALTGSVGKTTTKDLVAAACRDSVATVAAEQSFNNELGVPLTLLAARRDTAVLVTEIGARGEGHVAAMAAIARPDVAVVTAVAGVHLELFGDLAAVARAKGELVEALGAGGTAVLNVDDERVAAMADRHGGGRDGRVLHVGLDGGEGRDLWASAIELDELARPTFTAHTPWGDAQVTVGLSGEHHVTNALLALGAAGAAGIDVSAAADGIGRAEVSPLRSAAEVVGDVVVLDDSYNANPTSMRAGLTAAASIAGARRRAGHDARVVAVLGLMAEIGADEEAEHVALGRSLADLGVGRVVAVGDAGPIAEGARDAGVADVTTAADAAEAVGAVVADLRPGDVVLCKGSRVAGLEAVAEAVRTHLRDGARA